MAVRIRLCVKNRETGASIEATALIGVVALYQPAFVLRPAFGLIF